jgi:hypothetical protein
MTKYKISLDYYFVTCGRTVIYKACLVKFWGSANSEFWKIKPHFAFICVFFVHNGSHMVIMEWRKLRLQLPLQLHGIYTFGLFYDYQVKKCMQMCLLINTLVC